MKKYLFIALAALGFAACTEKGEDNAPIQNAELEESYIAINLMAADSDTRAATDSYGYELGTEAERVVKSAHFFFFDENGNPFNLISETNSPATAPGGSKNHLQLNINPMAGQEGDNINVSDISNAVLILNTYKGIYPKQVVAVLNWTPDNKPYSLDDLHTITSSLVNSVNGGYVMSNSVYMVDDDSKKMFDAVAIAEENIKKNAGDAMAAPINIYVERIAAKVVLTASGNVADNNIFSTQKTSSLITLEGITSTEVFVQLNGWELYNDYNTSYLVKNIDTSWTTNSLGLSWNDSPYYRCYWAQSQSDDLSDTFAWEYTNDVKTAKGFSTEYGFNVASTADYTDTTTYTYCGENTRAWSETNDVRTKVILKGQLMKKTGDNSYEPLTLAQWYGNDYAGVDNLKTAVANSLAYTLFYYDTELAKYVSIQPNDIECAETVATEKSYQTGFILSTNGQQKNWFTYSSATGVYTALAAVDSQEAMINATNAYLAANVVPALVYSEGQTYYIVDIRHLGNDLEKPAYYGVVRNHVYQIDILTIKGYGSPVYNGFSNIVTPEYPQVYDDTYVAAKINVLSWKVVKQGVNIE